MAEFFNNTIAKVMAALNKIMWPAPRAEAAIIEKGQILVIKSDQELFLPGGRVKTGELLEEAAIRECFEETDLKITVEKEVSRYYNNIGDLVFQFEAELREGQNKNSLTETWEGEPAWIDLEDLSEYKLGFKLSELITR